jgi:hypothetical protein
VRSSRNSLAVALTLIAASVSLSAHRRDEYLQAARLAIDPGVVQIELDLTPGIAVAEDVLGSLDVDRDGVVSSAETRAYVNIVMRSIRLDVDRQRLAPRVTHSEFPSIEAVRHGEGTIRLQIAATLPPLAAGLHQLRYANAHRPDVGAYLANALVPASDRVAVTDQERDVEQRELRVTYRLRGQSGARVSPWLGLPVLAGLIALGAVVMRYSSFAPGRPPAGPRSPRRQSPARR